MSEKKKFNIIKSSSDWTNFYCKELKKIYSIKNRNDGCQWKKYKENIDKIELYFL